MSHENNEYETRVLEVAVLPKGNPIYSQKCTLVEIKDDADGEFVKVSQHRYNADPEKSIAFSNDEWPAIQDAIVSMLLQCRTAGSRKSTILDAEPKGTPFSLGS